MWGYFGALLSLHQHVYCPKCRAVYIFTENETSFWIPSISKLFEEVIPPNEDLKEIASDFQFIFLKFIALYDLSREGRDRVKTFI